MSSTAQHWIELTGGDGEVLPDGNPRNHRNRSPDDESFLRAIQLLRSDRCAGPGQAVEPAVQLSPIANPVTVDLDQTVPSVETRVRRDPIAANLEVVRQ